MRLIFVRHGEPDNANGCLTPLGVKQAEVLVDRLLAEGITEIHSSALARAIKTAEPIARRLGLEIVEHPFINEIGGAPIDGVELPENGHPWRMAKHLAANGWDLMRTDWQSAEPYCHSKIVEGYNRVAEGIDSFLLECGFIREGKYYRVGEKTKKTVAIFSHCGSSTAAISRIFNIPLPFALTAIVPKHTAVTVVRLGGKPGDIVTPSFEIMNDARHIVGIETDGIMLGK